MKQSAAGTSRKDDRVVARQRANGGPSLTLANLLQGAMMNQGVGQENPVTGVRFEVSNENWNPFASRPSFEMMANGQGKQTGASSLNDTGTNNATLKSSRTPMAPLDANAFYGSKTAKKPRTNIDWMSSIISSDSVFGPRPGPSSITEAPKRKPRKLNANPKRVSASKVTPPPNTDLKPPNPLLTPPTRWREFKTPKVLPLPTRKRKKNQLVPLSPEQYWAAEIDYVERYGDNIWYVDADFGTQMSSGQIYLRLQQLITFLPNLKSLTLAAACQQEDGFNYQALPALPFLETLDISKFYYPGFIKASQGKLLIESCRKLQTINVPAFAIGLLLSEQGVQSLESFTVSKINNLENFTKSVQSIIPVIAGKLKKLSLEFGCTVNPTTLFQFLKPLTQLQHLKITLTNSLGLADWDNLEEEEDATAAANLSHDGIRSLELILSPSQRSYGFLKRFPKLKGLRLYDIQSSNCWEEEGDDPITAALKEIIRTNSANMTELWNLAPKLKMVNLKWWTEPGTTCREYTFSK